MITNATTAPLPMSAAHHNPTRLTLPCTAVTASLLVIESINATKPKEAVICRIAECHTLCSPSQNCLSLRPLSRAAATVSARGGRLAPLYGSGTCPDRLVGDHIGGNHRRHENQIDGKRQARQACRRTVQPEPPRRRAVLFCPLRTHPAGQITKQEGQQQQPENAPTAPRRQATPRITFHMPADRAGRRKKIRRPVEPGGAIASHLPGCKIIKQRSGRSAAHPVDAKFRHPVQLHPRRYLPTRRPGAD